MAFKAGQRAPQRIPGFRYFESRDGKQSFARGNPRILGNATEVAKELTNGGYEAAISQFVLFGNLADEAHEALKEGKKIMAEAQGPEDFTIRPALREGTSEIILRALKIGKKVVRDAREGLEQSTLHVGAADGDESPF